MLKHTRLNIWRGKHLEAVLLRFYGYINRLDMLIDVLLQGFLYDRYYTELFQLLLKCNYADDQLLKLSKILILYPVIRLKLF